MFNNKIITAIALLCSAPSALANVNIQKSGPNKTPDFTDNGFTLTADGTLTGLGNVDGVVKISAKANPVVQCVNPGGNDPPGQRLTEEDLVGSTTFTPDEFEKNGNFDFSVTTNQPVFPVITATEAGCPNDNWDYKFVDYEFNEATVTVLQEGNVVFHMYCTFGEYDFFSGWISEDDVSCQKLVRRLRASALNRN